MIALSCDRYVDDYDDEMWRQLNNKEGAEMKHLFLISLLHLLQDTLAHESSFSASGDIDLIIHMGDQIYADRVLSQWQLEARSEPTSEREAQAVFQQLVEDYRDVYRTTFGQRTTTLSNHFINDSHI